MQSSRITRHILDRLSVFAVFDIENLLAKGTFLKEKHDF